MPDTHTTPFAPAAASRLVGAYVIDLAILAALLGITWFVYFTPLTMTLITIEAVLASAIMLGATGRTPGMAAMKVCLIRDEGEAQTPSLGSAIAYTAMNVGLQLTVVGPLAAFAMVNDGHTWLTGPTRTRLVDLRKHAALAAGPGDAALGGGGYSRPERTPSGFDAVHTSPVSQDWGAPSAPLVPVPSGTPDRSAPGYRANDPYGPEFAAAQQGGAAAPGVPSGYGFSVPAAPAAPGAAGPSVPAAPGPSVPSAPVPPSGPSYGGSYGGPSVPPAPSAPAPGRIGGPTQFDEVLAAPAGPGAPVASASSVPAAPAVPSTPASMSVPGVRSAPTPSASVAGSVPSAPAGSAASSAPAGPGVPVASASGMPAAPSVRSAPAPSVPSAPALSVPSAPAPPPSRRDYQAAQAGTQVSSQWGGDGRSQAGVPGRSQWGAPAAPTVRPLLWIIFDSGQRELIDAPLTLGRAPASVEGSRSVVVPDTTVSLSRTHMRVGPTANGAWIEDSFSANGTQIRTPDGRITALTGGQAVEVPAGTEILMGERRATIVYADADTAH
ncbi:RDD family protein [Schaalia meyeri]|uniref:RDD family protein n=1 Tax=Schaalia meyeri TaxID=52773 RepID=UPI0020449A9F|nr:RDD family protein [Schaalia meyeri]MCM3898672.1 RDD family protein [Schaalia meyeri]